MIPKLLNEFDPETGLILINAIYFDGKWKTAFEEHHTNLDGQFRTTSGQVVYTPLMTDLRDLPYYENWGTKAVQLDYSESNLAMVFILPPEDVPLRAYIRSHMSPETLRSILSGLELKQKVKLTIPHFRIESPVLDMIPVLRSLGISDIFTTNVTNLSRISFKNDLRVSMVLQKAVVDCHEQGTKAAVASALTMMYRSNDWSSQEFTADRPFIFALIAKQAIPRILFAGIIEDPSSGERRRPVEFTPKGDHSRASYIVTFPITFFCYLVFNHNLNAI